MLCAVVLWASCLCTALGAERTPEVNLKGLGRVRGSSSVTSWSHRTVLQFKGVPYAKPPVDHLRFRPPEPVEAWEGTLDASKFKHVCPTSADDEDKPAPVESDDEEEDGDDQVEENCLHINVYTPRLDGRLAVLVFIHGGSFRVGNARKYLPGYLLERDVVLAVPQYRLGPLGFLSLQTDDVPGNVGLLDVLLALRWVHDHIASFGGDPKRVTVAGQSAGAAAASLLLVSPLVPDNLFQRVILQSGSSTAPWVTDPEPVPHARAIASLANCTQGKMADLATCLRGVNPEALLSAHSSFLVNWMENGGSGAGGNHAVLQRAGDQRFLEEDPMTSIRQGHFRPVPMMGGITQHEGSFVVRNMVSMIFAPMNLTSNKDYLLHNITRDTLDFSGVEDPSGMVTDLVTQRYFNKGELGHFGAMIPGLTDICGVSLLKAPVFRVLQENSRLAPSYLYSFNHLGRFTTFDHKPGIPVPSGVAHSDELIYLFPLPGKEPADEQDRLMSRTMVDLWANFVKYGKPTAIGVPEWPPVSSEVGPYLRISARSQVRYNFLDEYMAAVTEGFTSSSQMTGRCSVLAAALLMWVVAIS